jgi:hypothetical protein
MPIRANPFTLFVALVGIALLLLLSLSFFGNDTIESPESLSRWENTSNSSIPGDINCTFMNITSNLNCTYVFIEGENPNLEAFKEEGVKNQTMVMRLWEGALYVIVGLMLLYMFYFFFKKKRNWW